MRRKRIPALRRRLSYANVMATLALFFALTGSAAAVTKYLTANDPITAGDLAGSTYGNPVIANGKVTSAKIADGAITSAKFASSATAPNVLFANVNADGTVWASRGTSTTNAQVSGGQYQIDFDRDVGSCAWIGSRSENYGVSGAHSDATLTTFGWKSFYPSLANSVGVWATTVGSSFIPTPFSLVVIC
jgi:hypothetical protein